MNRPRAAAGFTLLEVVIAVALFLVASAAIFESLVGTKHLASLGAAKDQLDTDGNRILRAIAADLTTSGWEFIDPVDSSPYGGISAPAFDRSLRYYPMVQVQPSHDGLNTYGFNEKLKWTRIADPLRKLPDLPTVLPGDPADDETSPLTEDAWRRSFHARSQNLVFLRTAIGTWQQGQDPGSPTDRSVFASLTPTQYEQRRPSQNQPETLNFSYAPDGSPLTIIDWDPTASVNLDPLTGRVLDAHFTRLGVLHTSNFYDLPTNPGVWLQRFPDQPYGVTLDGGYYDSKDAENAPIKPKWESMRLPEGGPTLVDDLREYMYAVVPSPTALGLGRLVRAYRVRGGAAYTLGTEVGQRITDVATDSDGDEPAAMAMVIDRVLSDDVVRIVFDTYRTVDAGQAQVTTLSVNQVRVRLYLAKRQATRPDQIIYRVIETSFAMRSRASSGDLALISGILGTVPIGIVR